MELSDDGGGGDGGNGDEEEALTASRRATANRARMAAREAELAAMLAAPLVTAGGAFGGKYPTKTGKLELPADLKGERERETKQPDGTFELTSVTNLRIKL